MLTKRQKLKKEKVMLSFNVNVIMEQLIKGEISRKAAVDLTCKFICKNYKVFGLEKYDEDFRSDIVLSILEKGEKILDEYNAELGDYFNYLYMIVNAQRLAKIRSIAKRKVREYFLIQNGPLYLAEKEFSYSKPAFSPVKNTEKKAYVYRPISAECVRKTLTRIAKENKNKKLLILALKTSFYLTDEHISRISSFYALPEEHFHNIIQFFKDDLMEKAERRNKLEERRNYAYFHQKNYEKRIEIIKDSENYSNHQLLLDEMEYMLHKHNRSWNHLNKKLINGYIMLRPTNKTIADYVGICERQVAYYLNRLKTAEEDFD